MIRKARTPTRLLAGMSALILVLGALIGGLSASAALSSISGYAYGASVSATVLGVVTATLPPTPTAGPFNQTTSFSAANTVVSAVVPGLLTTGTLNAQTAGTLATGVSSSASVQTVNALAGALTATAVSSQCAVEPNLGGTSGSTTLTGATLTGVGALAVNPLPNTNLTLSVGTAGSIAMGTVTLNEQLYDPATNTLTVNAIHIRVTGGSILAGATSIDIIISHVECDAIVVPVVQPTPTPVVVTPTPTPVGATPTPVGATPTPFATPTPVVVITTPAPVATPSPAAASTAAAAAATRAPAATTTSARSGLPATSTAAGAGGLGLALVALGLAFLRRRQTTR